MTFTANEHLQGSIDDFFETPSDKLVSDLETHGSYNPTVGIRILRIGSTRKDGQTLDVYVASIDPAQPGENTPKGYVNPHVHLGNTSLPNMTQGTNPIPIEGSEQYNLIKGWGQMILADILFDSKGNPITHDTERKLLWEKGQTAGNIPLSNKFYVRDGQIHMAVNLSDEDPLYFMFTCPPEHMIDPAKPGEPPKPNADRFLLQTYKPEWHQKWIEQFAPKYG